MNILHMKYAVEVAETGSINKASETLLIAQPNLSRSIKELESDLGITIFERSRRGMTLTPEGGEFICHARHILEQIDAVEKMYKEDYVQKRRFSLCAPRTEYICNAFVNFSNTIGRGAAEIFYQETDTSAIVKNVVSSNYKLGIVRYAAEHDSHFMDLFEEKGLRCELIAEFGKVLLMSKNSKLANCGNIHFGELSSYIEVTFADTYLPLLSKSEVMQQELVTASDRRIFAFERCSQLELLSENPETFMWSSPITEKILERYQLIQRSCADSEKRYRDVLICRRDYTLSELDKRFIAELHKSKKQCFE